VLDRVADELRAHKPAGQIVASIPGLNRVFDAKTRPEEVVMARAKIANLLVTDPGLGPTRTSVVHPVLAECPLLGVVTHVDDATEGVVFPVTVSFTTAADVTPEGAAMPESSLVYTPGQPTPMDVVSHSIPLTRQALKHNRGLSADVDTFLSGGLLVRIERLIASTMANGSGILAQAFDTSIAKTLRLAIAKAQGALPELGPGEVVAALSVNDHAALDLSGADTSLWPARIVSSPALADGFAYVGRLKPATYLYTGPLLLAVGHIDDQYIRNRVTAKGTIEAFAHLAAPGAIVKTATA